MALPPLGRIRVDSMWMVVVLPEPFGPSRPKNWPAGDLEIEPVDGEYIAVTLGQACACGRRVRCDRTGYRSCRAIVVLAQEAQPTGAVSGFAFSLSLREFLSSRNTIGCTVTGCPALWALSTTSVTR